MAVSDIENSSSQAVGEDLGARVRDLFDAQCASCHHEPGTSGRKFDVTNFESLRTARNARFIDRDRPEQSPIYARLIDADDPMPPTGRPRVSTEQARVVLDWIRAGAPNPSPRAPEPDTAAQYQAALATAQGAFTRNVAPILQPKCGGCHDSSAVGPWYSGLPGVAGDIRSGRAAFDFGGGFPFNGGATPARVVGDTEGLENTVYENTMPLTRYTVVHPSSNLTEAERSIITRWTHETVTTLGAFVPRAEGAPAPGTILGEGQICSVLQYYPAIETILERIPGYSQWENRPGECASGTTCQDAGRTNGRTVSRCKR